MVYHKKKLLDDNISSYVTKFSPKINDNLTPMKIEPTETMINDSEGLRRAYENGDTYLFGDSLYIAGSHTLKDWYDDVTKVPFYGDLKQSTRYQEAEKALKSNPNVKRVIGHSLGGSVALELQKQYPYLKSQTYGAPVWDPMGIDRIPYDNYNKLGKPNVGVVPQKVDRYRNLFDPFSMFDGSANNNIKTNPFNSFSLTHDYSNIASNFSPNPVQNNMIE